MARRLIERQPALGFFLDQQELAVTLDDSSNGDIRFPDHVQRIHRMQTQKALF